MPDTHTYTHSCPPVILRVHEHTHIWCAHLQPFQECFDNTNTHKQLSTGDLVDDDTHIHTPISTLHCLHRHIFLLHVYRSISLARMRRYMQLAYLFHQYAKTLLSTDGRIADCTVRHPGVERPFSSLRDMLKCRNKQLFIRYFCSIRFRILVYFQKFYRVLIYQTEIINQEVDF